MRVRSLAPITYIIIIIIISSIAVWVNLRSNEKAEGWCASGACVYVHVCVRARFKAKDNLVIVPHNQDSDICITRVPIHYKHAYCAERGQYRLGQTD